MINKEFQGLSKDMYSFFWEIAFQNEISFFEANRKRYYESVRNPLYQLAALLAPTAQEMDPNFNVVPSAVVSRIRRDTRFSSDKSPYRDHMWLGFRLPKTYISECFTVYVEFNRESFGYGMGMYMPVPEVMQSIRDRIISQPNTFLELVNEDKFKNLFSVGSESFKKQRYADYPDEIKPWLNMKRLSFQYESNDLQRTVIPEIKDEIENAMQIMKPVYRFIRGLD